jgi:hypothetical protein
MSSSIRVKSDWPIVMVSVAVLLMPIAAVTQQPARNTSAATPSGTLTVDRIYSLPSLGGRPATGVAFSPDSAKLSFIETTGIGKESRTDLVVVDTATGQRSILCFCRKAGLGAAEGRGEGLASHGTWPTLLHLQQWSPSGSAAAGKRNSP